MNLITQCLLMINVAAMAAIFVYSACSLSVRQWTAKQPDYWIHSLRPLQNTSLHLFADSQNPNTGFRLFPSPNTSCFTQIPP